MSTTVTALVQQRTTKINVNSITREVVVDVTSTPRTVSIEVTRGTQGPPGQDGIGMHPDSPTTISAYWKGYESVWVALPSEIKSDTSIIFYVLPDPV